jgi:hypothetical protein
MIGNQNVKTVKAKKHPDESGQVVFCSLDERSRGAF